MLTPEQLRLRDGKLTASAVGALVSGDDEKVLNLWRFMVGDPDYDEPDWQRIWPVRLGEATEALNLEWYGHKLGRALCRSGEVVMHPSCSWACATLDGFDDGLVGPVDAKHVGGFEAREKIVTRYFAQMTWQMDCTGTKRSALSIIEGGREPAIEIIEWDAGYSAELWARAEAFMRCVESLTPPVTLPAVAAAVPAVREVDLSMSNAWVSAAADWLENRLAARTFGSAEKSLKGLIEPDVKRAFGAGVEGTRDRAGRLTLKESKS